MAEHLTVVKIGGNVIDNSAELHQFLQDFSAISGHKILIHGGGKTATETSLSMGFEPRMVAGRRITDLDTLRVVTMVYAGLINKNLVAQLQARGCNAIGLTGADGNIIKAVKRPADKIDYGFVGDLSEKSVSAQAIHSLLQAGFTPVVCAITHDGATQLLNTNADTIAAAISISMSALYETRLAYCFEKEGVLQDVNDPSSLLTEIKIEELEDLKKAGIVMDGMLPKLHNAFEAAKGGVSEVYIGKYNALPQWDKGGFGTKLTL